MKPDPDKSDSSSLDLAKLVMHLRASGLQTDTRQFLTAHRYLLARADHGQPLGDPADPLSAQSLISSLGPIFCNSPEEQERFEGILKGLYRVAAPKPSPVDQIKKVVDPKKLLQLWSGVGRLAMGLLMMLLLIIVLSYWFVPVVLQGKIVIEDPTAEDDISLSDADIRFIGKKVEADADGRFQLRFNRISSPAKLTVLLDGYPEVPRNVDADEKDLIQIVLKKLPPPPPIPRGPLIIGDPRVLTLPSGPGGDIAQTNWLLAVSVSLAVGPAAFLIMLAAERRRRKRVLKRLPIDARPELETLAAAAQSLTGLSGQQLRRLVGGLRRPRQQDALELDPAKTAKASARAGGIFSPVLVHRKQMPEYLVLISKKGDDDHQARLIDSLMEQLEQNDVAIARYYFLDDPQVCWPADNPTRQVLIGELAVLHHSCSLLVVAESALFFDPIYGNQQSWVTKLEPWKHKVLLTPDPPYYWTRREWDLADAGLVILPANVAGLQTYSELSGDWRIEVLFPATYARPFPPLIGSDNMRWIDRQAPRAETTEKLLRQLQDYLGPTDFIWLCACAIYPEISLQLTIHLAGAVFNSDQPDYGPAPDLDTLPSLFRLPWFRYGYMPDWLRLALIQQLTAEQEAAIRGQLNALLMLLVEGSGAEGSQEGLHLAAWIAPKDIIETASPGSTMQDAVFVGFMSGASLDRLAVDAPSGLGRLFQQLRTLPRGKISRAPRTLFQRLKTWLKGLMVFRKNWVRAIVAIVLSALSLAAIPYFTQKDLTDSELTATPLRAEDVAFDPDGKILASGSSDGSIRLWGVETGQERATLFGHTGPVYAVAFSPDGKILASVSEDNTVKLWETQTGQERATLFGHTGSVNAVAFSPDGKILASSSEDNTVKLWETQTGQERTTLFGHTGSVDAVAFSPDGKMLASGSSDLTIRLWDVSDGTVLRLFKAETALVISVAFSPDGQILASGRSDKIIRLWDVASGRILRELTGHTAFVKTVAFSPDGKMLASGSIAVDNTIRLWDVASGSSIRQLTDLGNRVNSVKFSPDGQLLAAGIGDRINIWPIDTNTSGPRILAFSVDAGQKAAEGTYLLSWQTANAINASLDGNPVDPSGTRRISPTETTTYELVAEGLGGQEARRTVTVEVEFGSSEPVAEIPKVIGLDLNAAIKEIKGRQFAYEIKQASTGKAKPGTILEQFPDPGEVRKYDTTIQLVVEAESVIRLPNFVGREIAEAMTQLSRLGLRAGVEERRTKTQTTRQVAPPGTVLSQKPGAGAAVKRGSTIQLVVQAGAEQSSRIVLPALIGRNVNDARLALKKLGLRIKLQMVQDEKLQPGTVVDQKPASGTAVKRGDTVLLVVAEQIKQLQKPRAPRVLK